MAPITRFVLVVAAGIAARIAGAPLGLAPLAALVAFTAPIETWTRYPHLRTAILGWALGAALASFDPGADQCLDPATGGRADLTGRFLATPRFGSAPIRRLDDCGVITVVVPPGWTPPREPAGAGPSTPEMAILAGRPVRVVGVWQEGTRSHWVRASEIREIDERLSWWHPVRVRWAGVTWRDGLAGRLHRLYGSRAPIVTALALARREGLDPEVREAFAVSGIAHLLAISGFHVGVIAGLTLAALSAARVPRRRAHAMAAGIAWTYVALIGFPAAACRAAVILAVVAVSGLRGRPPTRWGALSAAGLLLLAIDPRMLASPGFQLSFAGAGGLVAWSGALETVLRRALRIRRPQALLAGLAAGIAATVATLPIVAWHFERVSLVGIPMTLAATPLVSLALPGVLASLALDFGSPSAAGFLAGGVSALLDMLVRLADLATDRPWASVAVSRATVAATLLGVALATAVATHSRIHGRTRRTLVALYVSGSVCAWPLAMSLEGRGSLEVFMVDVGQGDAIAIRTPGGRWVLVDAGPEGNAGRRVGGQASGTRPRGGAGGRLHPVVAALRARGVRRIEMLVLTHPDLDHFGGGAAVLNAFEVGRVIDPALPAPKESYLRLLEEARRHGVPWNAAVAGQDFVVDDVRFRILHPDVEAVAEGEANQASVVLHVTWRDFDAVLTGDAYVDVERALIGVLPDIDLLKVGHHGSTTSTDSLFLVATRPEISLLSVGRRNGYGHPAPVVLGRLERVGSRVYRTDQDGDVRVLVRRDGAVRVMTSR